MTHTITIRQRSGIKKRPWAARITGTSLTHDLEREFIESAITEEGWTSYHTYTFTEPGIYQTRDTDGTDKFFSLELDGSITPLTRDEVLTLVGSN